MQVSKENIEKLKKAYAKNKQNDIKKEAKRKREVESPKIKRLKIEN